MKTRAGVMNRATVLKGGGVAALLSVLGTAVADAQVYCCDPGDFFGYANAQGAKYVHKGGRVARKGRGRTVAIPSNLSNLVVCSVPAGTTNPPTPPGVSGVPVWYPVAVVKNAGGFGNIKTIHGNSTQSERDTTPNGKNLSGNKQKIDIYVFVG